MANDELSFQAELLADARHAGCHAIRTADKFHIGRADCYIKHPDFPSVWIELKYNKSIGVKLGLTVHQRRFLKSEQDAGGLAGWACALVVAPSRLWRLYASSNTTATHIDEKYDFVGERKHGGKWPIRQLMEKLHG